MRAFGYVRLSKWDEVTTSPQRQREAIKAACQARGWDLLRLFEDIDVSAYNGNHRPGLEKMLGRLGEADAIVFMRLDRLARSVTDFARIRETCERARVELVSTDQQIDTSSAMGRAMQGIVATFAELESATIAERARKMHAYKRERGEWVGRVPYGWRLEDGKLIPEPEQQAMLTEVARRYVAGESLRAIAADVGMHHPNLARMLRTDRVIDALPPAVAGALVRTLAERGREGRRAKRSLLGGIARCGVCGAGMTVVAQRNGNGTRTAWGAYACRERGHVTISRPWLDQHVSEQVLGAIDTGELLKRLDKRKRPRKTLASSEVEARLELLERDFYERGLIARESFLRRREGLLKRLKEARDTEEDAGIDLPRELAANLSDRWPDLSLHGRRRIISAVLERVDVAKATGHGRIDPGRVTLVWRG